MDLLRSQNDLYSIRMRAAEGGPHERGGRHISGAERLLTKEELALEAQALVRRALSHPKGTADFIRITIDKIPQESIQRIPLLAIKATDVASIEEGHTKVYKLLHKEIHLPRKVVKKAWETILTAGGKMRGAALLDAFTGDRLDNTGDRGVRVSRMGFANPKDMEFWLEAHHYKGEHIREALVLASKVLSAKGVLGELCLSDDPDYITGYVSYGQTYHRISRLKEFGSPVGGRVFFVEPETDVRALKVYLEEQPVLVTNG